MNEYKVFTVATNRGPFRRRKALKDIAKELEDTLNKVERMGGEVHDVKYVARQGFIVAASLLEAKEKDVREGPRLVHVAPEHLGTFLQHLMGEPRGPEKTAPQFPLELSEAFMAWSQRRKAMLDSPHIEYHEEAYKVYKHMLGKLSGIALVELRDRFKEYHQHHKESCEQGCPNDEVAEDTLEALERLASESMQ